MTHQERIKKAFRTFAAEIGHDPKIKKAGVKFAVELEKILSDYEQEIDQLNFQLSEQIKSERSVMYIAEMYGIDLSRALAGWKDHNHVKNEFQKVYETQTFKIPEKLKDLPKCQQ